MCGCTCASQLISLERIQVKQVSGVFHIERWHLHNYIQS